MLIMLLKGISIGLIFGIPAGAVGSMTVQRTLEKGIKAGLITGLGSSLADCLYAVVGAFGLTLISDFLLKYQMVVNSFGCCLIFVMGIGMLLSRTNTTHTPFIDTATDYFKMFFSSFAVGITNPAAIMTFLFAFSWFGISGDLPITEGFGLVCGVFVGTYCWWSGLTAATVFFKRKSKSKNFGQMNRIFGIIMLVFAALILIRMCG